MGFSLGQGPEILCPHETYILHFTSFNLQPHQFFLTVTLCSYLLLNLLSVKLPDLLHRNYSNILSQYKSRLYIYFLLNFKFKSLHLSCKYWPFFWLVRLFFKKILTLTSLISATSPSFVSAEVMNVLNILIGLLQDRAS